MKNITELTDEDALKVFDIMGSGNPISDESKIFQIKDLLTTNKFYNQQTNLPGNTWLKIFKYLKSAGYSIGDESPESPSPSLQEAAEAYAAPYKLWTLQQGDAYRVSKVSYTDGWNAREARDAKSWQDGSGPFFIEDVRGFLDGYNKKEISISKITEVINIAAHEWARKNFPSQTNGNDNEAKGEKTIPDKETFYKSLNL